MPAKKNKRGDRGSVEEAETSTAKKTANMAADNGAGIEESIHKINEQEQPSLLEIKQLLVDIQIQIAAVLTENLKLGKEIEELKDSANFNEKELNDLKDSLLKTKNENKTLKDFLEETRRELKAVKDDFREQKEETEQLWSAFDDLEQYTRKNSLEIHGIPQNAYSDTDTAVIKVAEALNITVEPEDIEISHKLRRGTAIIVKFCSHKVKSKIYKERVKLKHVKISDLFPSYASSGQQHRIFVNENLTAYRRRMVGKANKRRQEGTLTSVWTLDGKMYIKTSPEGAPVRIFSEEDLDNL
ncbi:uncharacterized protein PF3D7_1120000-like [Montipora foliosa]|uniref:uncharacterized protein PF3D7_1120000-like n=1 Tax=Montipora foliosa TaxID=591990 RepID=UPI0035F19275